MSKSVSGYFKTKKKSSCPLSTEEKKIFVFKFVTVEKLKYILFITTYPNINNSLSCSVLCISCRWENSQSSIGFLKYLRNGRSFTPPPRVNGKAIKKKKKLWGFPHMPLKFKQCLLNRLRNTFNQNTSVLIERKNKLYVYSRFVELLIYRLTLTYL